MDLATLVVRLVGDASGIVKAMNDSAKEAQSWAKNVSQTLKSVGDDMKNWGQKATTFLTLPILAAGTAAFMMAADLQDAMGATDQIYGNSANAVKTWAADLETYYGIAEREALQYSNMMGSMLQNIGGLSENEAARQASALIELAGDLTAMYGGTTADAVRALTGALKGNNTMLDNYGMVATDAMIKTKALELGLFETSVSTLAVAEAQSKLGRSQEKWIELTKEALNNGKITEAQYKELQQAIWGIDEAYAQGLLGTDQWNGAIEDSLSIWRQYSTVLGEDGRAAILNYVGSTEDLGTALAGITDNEMSAQIKQAATLALILEQSAAAQGQAAREADGASGSVRASTTEMKNLAATIGTMLLPYGVQLLSMVRDVISWFQQLTPEQQKWILIIGAVVAAVGPLLIVLGSLISAVGAIIGVIGAITLPMVLIGLAIVGLVAYMAYLYYAWTNNWFGIQEKTASVIAFIQGLIDAGLQFISDLTSGKLGAVSEIWNNTFTFIQGYIQNFIAFWQAIFAAFTAAASGDWYTFGAKMREAFDIALKHVASLIQTSWSNIGVAVSALVRNVIQFFATTNWGEVGSNIVRGIANGITSGIGWIVEAARSAANAALQAAQGFLGIQSPSTVAQAKVGEPIGQGQGLGWIDGLIGMIPSIQKTLSGMLDTVMPNMEMFSMAGLPGLQPAGVGAVASMGAIGGGASSKTIVVPVTYVDQSLINTHSEYEAKNRLRDIVNQINRENENK